LDIVKPVDYYGNFSSITLLKGDTRPGTSLPIQASQCTLSWCVNEYEASVENGRFSERIAESWQPRSQQWDTPWDFSPKQLTPPARGGTTATPNFTISADSEMSLKIWLVEKLSFSDSFSVRAVEDGEMKWISEGDLAWLPDLSSNFSAHWGDYGATSMPPNYDVLRLFRTEDPLEIMSRLAKAITTYIRSRNESEQTDSPPGGLPTIPTDTSLVGPVVGMSQTLEVYIAVRWPWLALSGTLLMLTLLFFALVVAQSAKGGVAVWKSSPLALLFHGLDEQSVERLRDTKEVAEMERRARHVRVQLCDQGSGVILKEVDH
jgi:hypothetical protein